MSDQDVSPPHDYVFRFRLDEAQQSPVYQNRLVEMVREQLAALLDVVVLTRGSQDVSVDGFRLLGDPDHIYPLWKGSMTIAGS